MCVLSIKVPIRKKSGNLFNDPRMNVRTCVCVCYHICEYAHARVWYCVCMYVPMYVLFGVRLSLCMNLFVCLCVCMHICVSEYMYDAFVSVCVSVYICILCVYTGICTCISMYVRIHVCVWCNILYECTHGGVRDIGLLMLNKKKLFYSPWSKEYNLW